MQSKILSMAVLVGIMVFVSHVCAGETEDKIFAMTSGIKTRYLDDSGDLKLAMRDIETKAGYVFGNSSRCSRPPAGTLTRAFKEVLEAAAAAVDAKRIFAAAKDLDYQANHRSRLYSRCWQHMLGQSDALEEVAGIATQVIAAGTAAGWQ